MTKALLVITIVFLLFAFMAVAFLTTRYIDKLRFCHLGGILEANEVHCHWAWEDQHTHEENNK